MVVKLWQFRYLSAPTDKMGIYINKIIKVERHVQQFEINLGVLYFDIK